MCLKSWYYSITKHPSSVSIFHAKMPLYGGNDLMVFYNWGWLRLINKLSLIRSLNLFRFISQRLEYQIGQSLLNSYIQVDFSFTDCFTLLKRFPVKLDIPMCSAALVKNGGMFTIIINLWVTKRASVNNAVTYLFLKGIFKTKQRIQFAWWLENNLKFTELQVIFYMVD